MCTTKLFLVIYKYSDKKEIYIMTPNIVYKIITYKDGFKVDCGNRSI